MGPWLYWEQCFQHHASKWHRMPTQPYHSRGRLQAHAADCTSQESDMYHTPQGRCQYADAYTLTGHTHTHTSPIFIVSTYLLFPVGALIPWPYWYLSLRAQATSDTETWALGSLQAPLVPQTGPVRNSHCHAARKWSALGAAGSALPGGGGKVPKKWWNVQICLDFK